MGDGLQQAAGDRLRFTLTSTLAIPFRCSSWDCRDCPDSIKFTGVTVITVGLVSAGLLTLRQAIGIIMGANIGTTVTSFIIGFKLGEYALPLIFLGPCSSSLQKQNSKQYRAHPVWCRGIFYALNLISAGMSPLKDLPQFKEYMVTFGTKSYFGSFCRCSDYRSHPSFFCDNRDFARSLCRWFP